LICPNEPGVRRTAFSIFHLRPTDGMSSTEETLHHASLRRGATVAAIVKRAVGAIRMWTKWAQ
jgi:hypothetical protein